MFVPTSEHSNHLSIENIDKIINMEVDEKKEESPVNATDIGRFIGKGKKGRNLFQCKLCEFKAGRSKLLQHMQIKHLG